MNMSMILNVILSAVAIFVLAFCWIAAVMKSAGTAAVLAFLIALAGGYIVYAVNKKTQNKKLLKSQNKKVLESFADFLAFNDDNVKTLEPMLTYYGFTLENSEKDSAAAIKNGEKVYIVTLFSKTALNREDAISAVVTAKRLGAKKLYLFCSKVPADVKTLTEEHFPVEFTDINNTYALLEQCGMLPDFPKKRVKKAHSAAKYAFNRHRFGWYFTGCVFTALLSVVSYFPYYMLGWATVLLALALYSAFNRKYNPVSTSVTLN